MKSANGAGCGGCTKCCLLLILGSVAVAHGTFSGSFRSEVHVLSAESRMEDRNQ